MKIDKKEIAGKLAKVRSATLAKTPIHAVQGVLVKGNELTANNLKMGITATLPVEFDEAFILSPKAMDMIAALPDGEIEFKRSANGIDMLAKGTKSTFTTIPADDFPTPVQPEGGQSSSIDISTLKDLVESVIYAASTNESRPIHTGLLFEVADGYMNVVAVDGYRLAWNRTEYEGEFKFVVPKETLEKVLKLGISGDVEVLYTEKNAVFKSEDYTVYTNLLQGEFLNFRQSMPSHEKHITVDRKMLLECVKRALICMDNNLMPLIVCFKDSMMELSIHTSIALYAEEIAVEGDTEKGFRVGINARYFRDALNSYKSEFVNISYNTSTNPIIIKDGDLTSMVLPVRLKEGQ